MNAVARKCRQNGLNATKVGNSVSCLSCRGQVANGSLKSYELAIGQMSHTLKSYHVTKFHSRP
jgi:hypothetical protein